MDRLTMTSDKGGVAFAFDLDITCEKSEIEKILKLAEKLKEYEDLEEQGKLPKLPCAVGKTVYEISHGMLPLRVDSFKIDIDGIYANLVSDVYGYKYLKLCVCVVDFGKTVFLTREEAEAALKEL